MPTGIDQTKYNIVTSSIDTDKSTVAWQWAKTFAYNDNDDIATQMMKLVMASIACGDFKTRSSLLEDSAFTDPNAVLTVADYLSHASRIIIDYQHLSAANKAEFLAFFPQIAPVIARSATHAVERKDGVIKELKGFMLGVNGQLPAYIRNSRDFGVNIAMGGQGQTNFVGQTISANGYSGHVYFHFNSADKLILVGLEQTAPANGLSEALWGHAVTDNSVQSTTDQFGQSHSLRGYSDTYTAAGSLYFSDPVYQIKLLAEKSVVPPEKYGGMQVTLTNENWGAIKDFLRNLVGDYKKIFEILMKPPKRCSTILVKSYIAFDFKVYLNRFFELLKKEAAQNIVSEQEKNKTNLVRLIEGLQQGNTQSYTLFQQCIEASLAVEGTPEFYKKALLHIQTLFDKQIELDPSLKATYQELLFQQQHEQLAEKTEALLQQVQQLQAYFSNPCLEADERVVAYQQQLRGSHQQLMVIKNELTAQRATSAHDGTETPTEGEWEVIASVNQEHLTRDKATLERLEQLLISESPRLVSKAQLDQVRLVLTAELEQEKERVRGLSEENAHLRQQNAQQAKALKEARMRPINKEIASIKAHANKKLNRADKTCIEGLCETLQQQVNNYVEGRNTLQDFKAQSANAIEQTMNQLSHRPSWRCILTNLLACILGLGVGYLVAGTIHQCTSGQFLFFNHQASQRQMLASTKENIDGLSDEALTRVSLVS